MTVEQYRAMQAKKRGKAQPKKKRKKRVVKEGMARTNNAGAPGLVVIVTSDEVTHYVNPACVEIIAAYQKQTL